MDIEAPPEIEDQSLSDWLMKLWQGIQGDHLEASATWDPDNLTSGAYTHTTVTVTGAELGDQVVASFSLDMSHLAICAHVISADTVMVVISNHHAQAIDLASGTVYVRVFKRVTR